MRQRKLKTSDAANGQLPEVVPPRSVVSLVRWDQTVPHWERDIGRRFRIGYYRPSDGLDCVWLVNDAGEYDQSTDRKHLMAFFDIERLSTETDMFGESKRPLGPLAQKRVAHKARRVRSAL